MCFNTSSETLFKPLKDSVFVHQIFIWGNLKTFIWEFVCLGVTLRDVIMYDEMLTHHFNLVVVFIVKYKYIISALVSNNFKRCPALDRKFTFPWQRNSLDWTSIMLNFSTLVSSQQHTACTLTANTKPILTRPV